MNKLKPIFGITIILLLIVSCSTFTGNAYKVGSIGKQAYTITLTGAGDLYKAGLIDEDIKEQIIEYGTLYMNAHNASIEALARYVEFQQESDKARYLRLAAEATNLLAKLLNYARSYLVENGKEIP